MDGGRYNQVQPGNPKYSQVIPGTATKLMPGEGERYFRPSHALVLMKLGDTGTMVPGGEC